MSPNGQRIKTNHHGDKATFHEVVAAKVLSWLGVPHTPNVTFAPGSPGKPGVRIASGLVEGFTDWGDFLLKHGKSHTAQANHPAYDAAIQAYKTADDRCQTLAKENAMLNGLLKDSRQYKTGPTTQEASLNLIPPAYRQALHAKLAAQDTMLQLLPEAFRHALQEALFIHEVVGNWDFANHARANSGFVIRDGQLAGAIAVDFGNSGLNGFGGQSKDSTPPNVLAQPARLDCAFARMPSNPTSERTSFRPSWRLGLPTLSGTAPAPAQGPHSKTPYTLDPRRFNQVSPGFGLIGHLPRSEVFAQLMRPIIERNTHDLDFVPDWACAVAHRLSCMPPGALRAAIHDLCESEKKSAHQEIQALFDKPWAHPDEVAQQYEQRFEAIKARVGDQALARWRNQHPIEAQAIDRQVQEALADSGMQPTEAKTTPLYPLGDGHTPMCGALALPREVKLATKTFVWPKRSAPQGSTTPSSD